MNNPNPGAALAALRRMETKPCPVCGVVATKRAGWLACSNNCRQKRFRDKDKKS